MKTKWLLPVLALLVLFACKKEESATPENTDPFLGKWEIVAATGDFAESNEGTVYTFEADGTVKITNGFTTTGTYVRTETKITYEIGGIELEFSYTLSDNTMMWDNLSADQQFEFEKR